MHLSIPVMITLLLCLLCSIPVDYIQSIIHYELVAVSSYRRRTIYNIGALKNVWEKFYVRNQPKVKDNIGN